MQQPIHHGTELNPADSAQPLTYSQYANGAAAAAPMRFMRHSQNDGGISLVLASHENAFNCLITPINLRVSAPLREI